VCAFSWVHLPQYFSIFSFVHKKMYSTILLCCLFFHSYKKMPEIINLNRGKI
jgi:hypothetical protein